MILKTVQLNESTKTGLLPAIVQHAQTLQIIMSGFVEESAYNIGLGQGPLTLFTRYGENELVDCATKKQLKIMDIFRDCHNQTLLILVRPKGLKLDNNFGQEMATGIGVVSHLWNVIEERKLFGDHYSYTNKLFRQGSAKIAQKLSSDVTDLMIKVLGDKKEVVEEATDVFYHLFMLLQDQNISLDDIYCEIRKRISSQN